MIEDKNEYGSGNGNVLMDKSEEPKFGFISEKEAAIKNLEKVHSSVESAMRLYIDKNYIIPTTFTISTAQPLIKQLMHIGLLPVYTVDNINYQFLPWKKSFFVETNTPANSVVIAPQNSYVYLYDNEDKQAILAGVNNYAIQKGKPVYSKTFEESIGKFGIQTGASYEKILKELVEQDLEKDFIKMMSSHDVDNTVNIIKNGKKIFHLAVTVGMSEVHRDNLVAIANLVILDGIFAGKYTLDALLKGGYKIENTFFSGTKIHHPTTPEGSVSEIGLKDYRSLLGGAIKYKEKIADLNGVGEDYSKSKMITQGQIGFTYWSGKTNTYTTFRYPELDTSFKINNIEVESYKKSVRFRESYLGAEWLNELNVLKCETIRFINNGSPLHHNSHFYYPNVYSIMPAIIKYIYDSNTNDEVTLIDEAKHLLKNALTAVIEDCGDIKVSTGDYRDSLDAYAAIKATKKILLEVANVVENNNKIDLEIHNKIHSENDNKIVLYNTAREIVSDSMAHYWPDIRKAFVEDLHYDVNGVDFDCYKDCLSKAYTLNDEAAEDFYCGLLVCNRYDYHYE